MNPTVSVLMAVHNGMPWLPDAVESVCGQSFSAFEFIIVDDGSTDDTAQFLAAAQARDRRIRLVRNPTNVGLTRSLNLGLTEARGDWIARQDADDLWHSLKLEKQLAFLARTPAVGLLGTSGELVTVERGKESSRSYSPPSIHEELRWHLLHANPFIHASAVFARELSGASVRYDERMRCAQDYELWTRTAGVCRVANVQECLVKRRIREGSVGLNYRDEQEATASAISDSAMESLAPGLLTQAEKAKLRAWFREFPELLGDDDLVLARKWMSLNESLLRQKGMLSGNARALRMRCCSRVLSSIPDYRWKKAWRTGLMGRLCAASPRRVACDLLRRVVARSVWRSEGNSTTKDGGRGP